MIITLGKKGTRLDMSMLDQHAMKTLGRKVKLEEKLSPRDLAKLGYVSAASSFSGYVVHAPHHRFSA